MGDIATRVPIVDYLVLDDGDPHLVAHECTTCGARFFDRRNACTSCFGTEFESVAIATEGELRTFTIVAFAAPGVEVPFVAGVVDCDGTSVRGNLRNVEPDAEHVHLHMPLRLTTYSLGTDDNGVEAVGFAFEPALIVHCVEADQPHAPPTPSEASTTNRAAEVSASEQGWRRGRPTARTTDALRGLDNQ